MKKLVYLMIELVIQGIVVAFLNTPWWVTLVIIFLVIISVLVGNPKHFRKVRSAGNALNKLKQINDPAKQFRYLRQVDPFVFEEMILTSLKNSGHSIRRNKRYTGDGGIDGRATIDGVKTLIQAKKI